jgi:hypothetical protein
MQPSQLTRRRLLDHVDAGAVLMVMLVILVGV